ncbi:TRAM1-like protein & fumonisin [Metarhizium album ARSEF 1941]|uniref:TRAM1-like protein & fumonisin n=1 Tax=Metarhizium album (strain ARSEF 1941) TaxID=1081103 RepID=A0A0B2X5J4_METAS|nr:TRAM1-like protein & fumonisin [Metarhizium album ARSEF 1941]KHO00581.1 TRAM1-like protein & fumonisin [Metarhizium album ARSEF 1941]
MVSTTNPIPAVTEPYHVLIRVSAVALNPSDYRMPAYNPVPGAVLGCDFMGTVVETGSQATSCPPGTRLCGPMHGCNAANPNNGAFAEFLVADARVLLQVPDAWSDLEGAALGGVGWATVALAMEDCLKLTGRPSAPEPPRADGSRVPVLVYGGATATGTMACQILARSGYSVIATSSTASSALVKAFGAMTTYPYTSPTCGETVREATKGTLRHAIDCVTNPDSVRCCFTALGRAGARYASLDYALPEWRTRKSVKVDMPVTYALWGNEVKIRDPYHREADPTKLALAMRWRQEIQSLLDAGQLKCHPVREIPGRWKGIVQGLELLKAGQTSPELPVPSAGKHPAVGDPETTLHSRATSSTTDSRADKAAVWAFPKSGTSTPTDDRQQLSSVKMSQRKPHTGKTRRRKDDVPRSFSRWLLDNQVGFSFNLVALLFLTHACIPAARQYTSKFFTLSYRNGKTGKYAAGYDDFYFMTFVIVILTGLRAFCMGYILAPLASRWGVLGKKNATRFAEQGWMLMYYNAFWPTGMYLYYNSKYFLNMEELWTDWPQREIDGLMKAYILGQWGFWIQMVLVINIEERRKDHWQMLTHHFVTIALLAGSYAYHQTRVANLILILMDVIDLFLPLAKCLKYLGFTTICDVIFGGFIISWVLARHVLYMVTCWSIYFDFPRMTPPACYRGSADDLEGPLPIPTAGWSHLLEPFRNPSGVVCLNKNVMYAFLLFLLFLQVMMIMWFTVIVQITMRVLQGKRAEDLRSNSEAEESDEEDEVGEDEPEQPRYLEKECVGEAIDWTARERRGGVTKGTGGGGGGGGGSSSSSVSFPGHRDRKELLNRIGCEKQIE